MTGGILIQENNMLGDGKKKVYNPRQGKSELNSNSKSDVLMEMSDN